MVFFWGILLKLKNTRYLPKVIGGTLGFVIISSLFGIPICSILCYFDPMEEIVLGQIITSLIGGILTISLILSSVVGHISSTSKEKKHLIELLFPFTLIIFAVFFAICSYVTRYSLYFAFYYLILGTIIFLNEIRIILYEETIGASLWERLTYESRENKIPHLHDKSQLSSKVFEDKIQLFKGDTILAVFEFLQDGRTLAKKIINTCEYAIYISSDRPYTVIEEEFKDYKGKLYCIDCFTNLYGLGEFKQAEKGSNSYTLNPPSIRELHSTLREIRKNIVSHIGNEKDWEQLDKIKKKEIEKELGSTEAKTEREKNVWIVYDSISSLMAVFELEPLLMFLTHDTTVDKTIGRNTLLLMKDGALDSNTISRLESLCEHILNVKIKENKTYFVVKGSTDVKAQENFCIGN